MAAMQYTAIKSDDQSSDDGDVCVFDRMSSSTTNLTETSNNKQLEPIWWCQKKVVIGASVAVVLLILAVVVSVSVAVTAANRNTSDMSSVSKNSSSAEQGEELPVSVTPESSQGDSDDAINLLSNLTYHSYDEIESAMNCVSPACKSRLATLRQVMDPTANPCSDFYQYACGNFNQVLPEEFKRADNVIWESVMADQVVTSLVQAFNSPPSENLTFWPSHVKAKQVFQVCLKKDPINDLAALQSIVEDFGGFRLRANDSRWLPSSTDTIAKTFTYTLDSLFTLTLVQAKRSPPATFVLSVEHLPPGVSPSETDLFIYRIEKLVKIVLPPTEAALIDEEEISRITQFSDQLSAIKISAAFAFNDNDMLTPVAVNEMKTICPRIDWIEVFKVVAASAGIDGKTASKLTSVSLTDSSKQFLGKLCDLLGDYLSTAEDRRALHNYLVAKSFAGFLTKELVFGDDWLINPDDDNDDITCLNQTSLLLPFAVGSFYEKNFIPMEEARPKLKAMLAELWKNFIELIKASKRFSNDTKKKFVDKMNSLHFQIGFPEWTANKRRLDKYHKSFTATNSHVQNLVNGHRLSLRRFFELIGVPIEDADIPFSILDINAMLYLIENKICVLSPYAQSPHFDPTLPDNINFGSLGQIIAHELNHIFDEEIFIGEDFLEERRNCVSDYYSRFSFNGVSLSSYRTVPDDMADIGSIGLNFRTYKAVTAHVGSMPEVKLSGVTLNSDKIFLIATAQNNCVQISNDELTSKMSNTDHSPGPYRVNGTMANVEEFATIFNCPVNSPMNPVKKCAMY